MFFEDTQKANRWRQRAACLGAGIVAAVLIVAVALFAVQPTNHTVEQKIKSAFAQTQHLPLTFLRRLIQSVVPQTASGISGDSEAAASRLTRIKIDVAPQYVRQLEQRRLQAQSDGILIAEQGDEVPALLTLDHSDRVKTTIRLKGDFADHLTSNQFSLRVKVRGDDAFLGMRRFSIQRPATRGGIGEPLLLEHMRSVGVLAPRYFFVHVSFNELDMGVMAIEEHFSKELLESQNRREGVILSVDEQLLWRQRRLNYRESSTVIALAKNASDRSSEGRPTTQAMNKTHINAYTSAYAVFQENKVWKSDVLRHDYRNALGLLRGYKEGLLLPQDVFDMRLLARYHAVLNLWNATHGLIFHNLRFYFNPVSRLFEPVAFDNNAPVDGGDAASNNRFASFYQGWTSPQFIETYMATLRSFDRSWQDGTLVQEMEEMQRRILKVPNVAAALETPIRFEQMRKRLDFLLQNEPRLGGVTKPSNWHRVKLVETPKLDSVASVYWVEDGAESFLEIQNLVPLDVHIERVWGQQGVNGAKQQVELTQDKRSLGTQPFFDNRVRVPVTGPVASTSTSYYVEFSSPALADKFVVKAIRYFPPFEQKRVSAPEHKEFLKQFEFIEDRADKYVIPAGDWAVERDLIVPANKALHIEPGAILRFAQGVRMVVSSRLVASGSETHPIQFLPQGKSWSGLVVLANVDADYRSILDRIEVSGVSFEETDYWRLTGAVTVNRGGVLISNSRFFNIDVEDAVNAIDATVTMRDSTVEKTRSDAIDLDFCVAMVSGVNFSAIGGDGLDVSGSTIKASELSFVDIADKALSIGEQSQFDGRNIRVERADIGIASKDGSRANISDSTFLDISNVAFTAYIKKPEYSGAQLQVQDSALQRAQQEAIAIMPSTISIDGDQLPSSKLVNSKIYATIAQLETAPSNVDPEPDNQASTTEPNHNQVD